MCGCLHSSTWSLMAETNLEFSGLSEPDIVMGRSRKLLCKGCWMESLTDANAGSEGRRVQSISQDGATRNVLAFETSTRSSKLSLTIGSYHQGHPPSCPGDNSCRLSGSVHIFYHLTSASPIRVKYICVDVSLSSYIYPVYDFLLSMSILLQLCKSAASCYPVVQR
jgi:hypothetical protein